MINAAREGEHGNQAHNRILDTYVAPVSGEVQMRSTKGQVYEYACHEGNYAMADILAATPSVTEWMDRMAAMGVSPSQVNDALARKRYEAILEKEPKNEQALLGYAGLVQSLGGDPSEIESLLKRTRQTTEYSCGASALQSVLAYWGKDIDERELEDKARWWQKRISA